MELLVVIGIIALLISILLPTLTKARQQALFVVCQSNIRQCGLAFTNYAVDNKGRVPGNKYFGAVNLDWAGTANALYTASPAKYTHPLETSVLRKYMTTYKILQCPVGTQNQYYDYTMMVRLAGAKTNLTWKVSYPIHPEINPASAFSPRLYFPGIPLLIEEHDLFNQKDWPDGAFSNSDQFTIRHNGKCAVLLLDGSVLAFAPPHGKRDTTKEAQDLQNIHLMLHDGAASFTLRDSYDKEWGWANNPKLDQVEDTYRGFPYGQ